MPTIEIDKREFTELVGKEFEDEKLIEEGSFLGAHWHSVDGNVCEVETYPNRPDLLSVEGLARAYRGFFSLDTGREEYHVGEASIEVEVDKSVEDVRPFIAGAVIRGLDLSRKKINGLIQLQEKMHETLGRRRDKLAIGLHDLSQVEPPFTYKAVEPEKVSFKPLEYDREMQLGEILEEHEKGQKYSWILEEEQRYPVIVDSEDKVLSFPPIINNQLTEVDTGTEDIFIDVTGKNKETVFKALNILTTALAERGGSIEAVNVEGERMPVLRPESMELDPEYFEDVSGLDLSRKEIIERLEMMKYGVEGGKRLEVEVPCYRTDVMHQYDLIEDVIIAHRYTNIEPELPEIDRIGREQPVNNLVNVVRDTMTGKGALEALTYIHSREEDLKDKMQIEKEDYVKVENPLSQEYSAIRNKLTPSLLEVLEQNKHHSYPQEFFESAKVAELDKSATGASNKQKLAYVKTGNNTGFTDAREALQVLERDLGITFEVEKSSRPFLKDSKAGRVEVNGEEAGFIGEFSEKVIEDWSLEHQVAGFELDLETVHRHISR
ncbi:MAG: phenylalanine--tRNA ligase subunit beta [Candidatus Nanohalobium sp.]